MKKFILCVSLMTMILAGCKPTEQGYKSAYDAALSKRRAAEAEQMLPSQGIQAIGGPQMRVIDGDSVYVDRQPIKVAEGVPGSLGNYNVAISFFKMKTNAVSSADGLCEKGYDALPVQSARERWYVVAGKFDTLTEAVKFYRKFTEENPGFNYIGLPGAPVILPK